MVGRIRVRASLAVAAASLLLVGCDYFASPLPGFLSGVERSVAVDVSDLVDGELPAGTRYDLAVVGAATDRRVLLKVEPPNPDPDGYRYDGRLIVLGMDMTEEQRLAPASSTGFISRPYGYGHDGKMLAGYIVYDLDAVEAPQELVRHGLEGFVTVDGASTHLFSGPSGAFVTYHLEIRSYFTSPWALTGTDAEQVAIVPDGVAKSAGGAPAELGYQLLGIARDGGDLLFLLSQPSQRIVFGVRASLSDVLDAATDTVLVSSADDRLFTISADRPQASADDNGFFLMRRDGWFERYDWDGDLVARVTGDISFSRRYAFDVEGDRFYRYDPDTSMLSLIGGWW